jgi:hypothetical protein
MKILELQEYAKKHGFDSVEFEFTNFLNVVVKGKWLDAYFGLFTLNGAEGFISVKQWQETTGDVFDFRINNALIDNF